jgi:excinuclease ABC subunit B
LIQTAGRAARNISGEVLLYADQMTGSIQRALGETDRRRKLQKEYNREMGITPESVQSSIKDILSSIYESDYLTVSVSEETMDYGYGEETVKRLEEEMKEAAKKLDFERAVVLRDRIKEGKKKLLEFGIKESSAPDKRKRKKRMNGK